MGRNDIDWDSLSEKLEKRMEATGWGNVITKLDYVDHDVDSWDKWDNPMEFTVMYTGHIDIINKDFRGCLCRSWNGQFSAWIYLGEIDKEYDITKEGCKKFMRDMKLTNSFQSPNGFKKFMNGWVNDWEFKRR